MSPLARVGQSSLRAATRSSPAQVRTIYTTKGHVAHSNFPFAYANKRTFGMKMGLSLGTAFLVPFIAAGYQLRKSAGGSN
ncbi:hypothetical protein LXA43DRAFT_1098450 [Ganoderma leucocontextum]|nr:hypothetical protein LXA43DRAFT_1098450 [Ganoderma leucocontextum]